VSGLLRRNLILVDVGVAAILLVLWIVEVAQLPDEGVVRQLLAYVLAIGATVPLVARRIIPRTAFAVMAVCFAAALVLDSASTGIGCALVAYTILVDQSRRAGVAVVVAGYALILVAHVAAEDATLTDLFFNAITFAMVIAIAELVRTRLAYAGIHAERTAQLEADRIAVTQRAVDSERMRIARELHDVVAHSISSIAVQSSVGRERLRTDPDVTEEALRSIESSSRTALSEMRRMLGILRPEGESSGGLSPAPGLERVDEIVSESNRSGVTTSLVIHGTRPAAVPPGVDLCAFRIVQEALTNVVKHAPCAHVDVVIRWSHDSIAIDVDDNGHGQALLGRSWDTHGGHGLLGMSERVALFGGKLVAGPRPSGGFALHAYLPFEEPRASAGTRWTRRPPDPTNVEPEPAT
jgi:signal transduction histidine kinase